jgi:hypothetical protein
MKIETTQTNKQEIEIPVPSFYKDAGCSETINHMRGIIDNKTVADVWESPQRTNVSNGDTNLYSSEIVEAFLKWKPVTELEFMTAYNRALHSMSLTPELSEFGKEAVI